MTPLEAYESLYRIHILLLQIIAYLSIILAGAVGAWYATNRRVIEQRKRIATLEKTASLKNGKPMEPINWTYLRGFK